MADYLDDPRITAYLLDEMSPDERNRVFEVELSQSEQLRGLVERHGRQVAWLRAELAPSTTARLSEMQRAQIAAILEVGESAGDCPRPRRPIDPMPRTPARRRSHRWSLSSSSIVPRGWRFSLLSAPRFSQVG